MAYRGTKLGADVRFNQASARVQILKAFRKTDGNATHAATELDVSLSMLNRWIRELGLRDEIQKLRGFTEPVA